MADEEVSPVELRSTSLNQSATNVLTNGSIEHDHQRETGDLPLALSQSNQAKKSNSPSTSSPSPSSSSPPTITTATINNRSVTAVNHFTVREEEEEEGEEDKTSSESNINRSNRAEEEEEAQQQQKTSPDDISAPTMINGEYDRSHHHHHQRMSSDDESENDSELLHTLSQLHGLSPSARPSMTRYLPDEYEKTPTDHLLLCSDKGNNVEKNNDMNNITTNASQSAFSLNSSASSMQSSDDELMPFNHPRLESPLLSLEEIKDESTANFTSSWKSSTDRGFAPALPSHQDGNDVQDLTRYLRWIINHFDEKSRNESKSDVEKSSSLISDDEEGEERLALSASTMEMSSVEQLIPIIEQIVSDAIDQALNNVHDYEMSIEQLVRQILTEAIYQVYQEDQISTDTANLVEPFEQQSASIFQVAEDPFMLPLVGMDQIDVNVSDPWSNNDLLDQSEIRSITTNIPSNIDDAERLVSTSLFIDTSDSALTAQESMKYRLTAAVNSNSSDNRYILPDSFVSKVIDFAPHFHCPEICCFSSAPLLITAQTNRLFFSLRFRTTSSIRSAPPMANSHSRGIRQPNQYVMRISIFSPTRRSSLSLSFSRLVD